MKDKVEKRITGPVELKSKFNFEDEIWFIYNHHIQRGRIIEMKGHIHQFGENYIELLIEVEHGDVGFQDWVNEKYCYKTKEELLKSLG